MNMDVTNKELQRLLKSYLKRLDKMDKDRDKMMNKLKALSEMVKHINLDIDNIDLPYLALSLNLHLPLFYPRYVSML